LEERGPVVTRVLLAELERLECPVLLEQQDGLGRLVMLEIPDHLEALESRDPREPKDHRARMVRLEIRGLPDSRVNQVSRVPRVHPVSRVKSEEPVTRDRLARLAPRVLSVPVERPVNRANRGKKVSRDNRVPSDHPAARDRLGRSEQPAHPELLESLAIPDSLEWPELRVS
jgi:hypothetical protein